MYAQHHFVLCNEVEEGIVSQMHDITDYKCWVQADEVGDEEERENIPPADTPPSDRKVSLP